MKRIALINLLCFSLLAACSAPANQPAPVSSPSTAPTSRPETTPSVLPVTGPISFEFETGLKILGAGRFPQAERRGQRGIMVMTFSGTDAGSTAELDLTAIKGRYQLKLSYFNHSDSPEMFIKLGNQTLTLPAGSVSHSNGDLAVKDFGVLSLDVAAGSKLSAVVGGTKKGGAGAWIGLDSLSLTPAS